MTSLAHRVAVMPPRHIRACSRFIEKDQARGVKDLFAALADRSFERCYTVNALLSVRPIPHADKNPLVRCCESYSRETAP